MPQPPIVITNAYGCTGKPEEDIVIGVTIENGRSTELRLSYANALKLCAILFSRSDIKSDIVGSNNIFPDYIGNTLDDFEKRCSFCQKKKIDVAHLILGRSSSVCDECIHAFLKMIE